ncbi:MAG TPA: S1/P1 nuclease [Rhodanobacteraceae bacterium]|nr:S1/P1 nuclease [Rhodanobacteraceae bacterium]
MRWTFDTRRRVRALATVIVAMLACAPPAFAWGPLGHRVVARLAEAQLTPRAEAEVQRLLAVRGKRYLDQVSNWADDLRDTDPDLYRRTARLHYVNFDSGDCIYEPPRDCRNGECVVAAISKYSAILADRSNSPAERAQALAFVVHLVADVHQPLHAGYRHDAGGNDFQVRWHGRGTNLHRIWDSAMLDDAHRSTGQYTRRLLAERTPVATGGTPAEWAEESCRIDRDGGVYPSGHFIDESYMQRERPIAERRLRQAGARLAALLNRDLANG